MTSIVRRCPAALCIGVFRSICVLTIAFFSASQAAVFDVRDFGATARKADDARPAIQQAIDACAAAGGGMVRLPAGQYTSGTLRLRSGVQFQLDAGATLFASPDPKAFDFGQVASKAALLYGENLDRVSITGQGTVDGQAEYEWRLDDFEEGFDHKILMQSLGKPVLRSFPKDFPKRQIFPHLIWLGNTTNLQVTGVKFVRSPNWSIALYACERALFENLYVYTSLREGVWADGIDLDGCRDVSITNCVIETGDDCVVFISENSWGPPRVCENITVSNCRLSSASAGLKFSEGNRAGIRNILVRDTLFTNVNRAAVFSTIFEGYTRDVVLSNLTIYCNRFDWFWAGDGQPFHIRLRTPSESNQQPRNPAEPPPGPVQNLRLYNITAHGKGSSPIFGHPETWLDGISFQNVKLFVSCDPGAPFEKADNALQFRYVKNLKLKDLQVFWEAPTHQNWNRPLQIENVSGLELDGFTGRPAWPERNSTAVLLDQVTDATIRNCTPLQATNIILQVCGPESRNIRLMDNPRAPKIAFHLYSGVQPTAVKVMEEVPK